MRISGIFLKNMFALFTQLQIASFLSLRAIIMNIRKGDAGG
jgi:hypothetical protein